MYYKFILALYLTFLFTSSAVGQVWTSASDRELRRDVELLKTYNVIDGPVNSWPISWKQITNGISASEEAETTHPAHVRRAMARIKQKSPRKNWHIGYELDLSNEPALVRSFGDNRRADVNTTLSIAKQKSVFDLKLEMSFRNDDNEKDITFDGSFFATSVGNWSLYTGAIERWWGPGQDNTLLLSTNARPMMSFGLRRNHPTRSKNRWLHPFGPWTWDMFIARMGKNRHIPNAFMFGMRLGFEPFNNFEVGLSRSMQICGVNRPCGVTAWTKALVAFGDLDNGAGEIEPGNQMASIDFAYSRQIGDKGLRIYISGTAEDQNVVMPFQYSRLLGATLTSPIGDSGDMLAINAEWSDSGNVLAWFFGERRGGVMYRHSIYKTGHIYSGRSLGHSLDNDSKLISLTTTYTRKEGDSYRIALRMAAINWDNNYSNTISAARQNYKSIEASAANEFSFGRIEVNISLQTKAYTLTQGRLPQFTTAIVWQKEF